MEKRMEHVAFPANRISAVIEQAWRRPFYATHWGQELGQIREHIRNGEYHRIPVIRKRELSQHWGELMEYGDFTDVVSSSGTTGRPVDLPVHRLQEMVWVDCVSRVLTELGAKPGDRLLHLLSNNDMFTLGPLVLQAAKKVGLGPFRCSPQRVHRILDVVHYHQPAFVVGNPVVMLKLAEEQGNDFPDPECLPDYAYFGACNSFDANNQLTPVAQRVKELWGLKDTLNEYGCSEVGSIGHECLSHAGFHINEDAVYVELIDPDTGLPVPPGQPGEVVVTSLTMPRGFLAVRYATGDIASWMDYSPCECGRTSPRMGAIIGRIDHQLKIQGQTVFPDLIFDVLGEFPEVSEALVVRYPDPMQGQQAEVWIGSETAGGMTEHVREAMLKRLAVSPNVRSVPTGLIQQIKAEKMASGNGVKVPRLVDLPQHVETYV
ncbi:MAG: AMP-binding protein [Candidatus Thiodiazotropha sp.]